MPDGDLAGGKSGASFSGVAVVYFQTDWKNGETLLLFRSIMQQTSSEKPVSLSCA